jgi:hypothetical protein
MAEAERNEKEQDNTGASGWMAPISKLFQVRGELSGEQSGIVRSVSARGRMGPPRIIPKLGPALSASATTVNVEFSGTGVGRSTTSTVATQALPDAVGTSEIASTSQGISPGVMEIFAGAPRAPTDPWVVLSKGPRRVQSFILSADKPSPPPIRRTTGSGRGASMLSRHVDAVIDGDGPLQHDEGFDDVRPLLQHKLHRRGLSDSSIHSTFTSHADSPALSVGMNDSTSPRYGRISVFKTLSGAVQSFRMTAGMTSGAGSSGSTPSVSPQKPSHPKSQLAQARAPSPGVHGLLPNLSSWAAAATMLDPTAGNDPFSPSSLRDESPILQKTRHGRLDTRTHHEFV